MNPPMKSLQLFFCNVSIFIRNIFSIVALSIAILGSAHAQTLPLPYVIGNLSEFSDDEIYVSLVGKIDVNIDGELKSQDVWIDMATGDINEMTTANNTLQGPIYNGNKGPGGDGMYADVFTVLSNIPNKTIEIPHIYAAHIFISFESPLYLYFFGPDDNGVGGGYSAPSLSNNSDPNLGLKYELIELTYGDNGLWTNTTRVDAYQYPMGLEVWGAGGFYKRVGEVLNHDDILEQWRARVGDAFQASLDEDMEIILNPSKSTSFQDGETYNNYFSDYVDAVWARYENEDMYLSIGEAGVWLGRVIDDQFIFTEQTDQAEPTIGMISAKPNTLEILEASGVLAEDVTSTQSIHADQNIQKHFSAAFNRGAIDINAPANQLLVWDDLDTYFGATTHNEYVAFWHSPDISFEGETYAFAYDDVFDYSSTIQSTVPEKVKITIGGFINDPYVAAESIGITSITGGSGKDTFNFSTYMPAFIDGGSGSNTIIRSDSNSLVIDDEEKSADDSGIKIDITSAYTILLEATVFPLTVNNPAVIWQSNDSAVATVVDGLITGIATGTALITASSYDDTVSTTVTVNVNGGDYSNDSTMRIEAEDYSAMFGIETQTTTDSSNNDDTDLNVGEIDVDDYMDYQITIPTAGEYIIAYRVSSIASAYVNISPSVDVQVDGSNVLSTTLPTTGSWDTWETHVDTLTLPAGDITLRFLVTGANWNINWFDLTLIKLPETNDISDGFSDGFSDGNTDACGSTLTNSILGTMDVINTVGCVDLVDGVIGGIDDVVSIIINSDDNWFIIEDGLNNDIISIDDSFIIPKENINDDSEILESNEEAVKEITTDINEESEILESNEEAIKEITKDTTNEDNEIQASNEGSVTVIDTDTDQITSTRSQSGGSIGFGFIALFGIFISRRLNKTSLLN